MQKKANIQTLKIKIRKNRPALHIFIAAASPEMYKKIIFEPGGLLLRRIC